MDDLFLKYALNTKHKTFGEDSYAAFKDILEGKYDHVDEQYFYMASSIEAVLEKHEATQRS